MYCSIGVLNTLFISYDMRQTAVGLSKKYGVKVGVYNTTDLILKSSMIAVQIMIYSKLRENHILVVDIWSFSQSQSLKCIFTGTLYSHWEDPEDAAFYLCNLLAIVSLMYAVFAAVAFRGLEGVKKQKKKEMGMIEKAIKQFKVFKVFLCLFDVCFGYK